MFRNEDSELLEHAKNFHSIARVNYYSGEHQLPLLSNYISFPNAEELSKLYELLRDSSGQNEITFSYVKYFDSCKANLPAKPITETSSLPITYDILPGKVPILDHVTAHLLSQSPTQSGGTFQNFLYATIETCQSNRQMSSMLMPKVNSSNVFKSNKK